MCDENCSLHHTYDFRVTIYVLFAEMPSVLNLSTMITQWLPIWQWTSMHEYNCSRIRPIGKQWTIERGEPWPLFGWWSMIWGGVCQAIYIPCLVALYKERNQPCYRIMLWLAIVDIIALMCNSIGFGYILIEGSVFCSRPWFVWITGCLALGTWCGTCAGCLLLVVFRLFELLGMSLRFEAHVNILLVLATCYTLFVALFTPPLLTSTEYAAMLYDPLLGDIPTEYYLNWIHIANNLLIVTTSSILYVILIGVICSKQGLLSSDAERVRVSTNAPIFIQASVIAVLNVTASLENIYMNFFDTSLFLNVMAHISWQITHGVPPFIYLALNKCVQRHCCKFLRRKIELCWGGLSRNTTTAATTTRSRSTAEFRHQLH